MSTQNVISLDARKAQNEAMWLRMERLGESLSCPVLSLLMACKERDQDAVEKCMCKLRAIAAREFGLPEAQS